MFPPALAHSATAAAALLGAGTAPGAAGHAGALLSGTGPRRGPSEGIRGDGAVPWAKRGDDEKRKTGSSLQPALMGHPARPPRTDRTSAGHGVQAGHTPAHTAGVRVPPLKTWVQSGFQLTPRGSRGPDRLLRRKTSPFTLTWFGEGTEKGRKLFWRRGLSSMEFHVAQGVRGRLGEKPDRGDPQTAESEMQPSCSSPKSDLVRCPFLSSRLRSPDDVHAVSRHLTGYFGPSSL